MTTITAETILSSQHTQFPDLRLTTMLLRYPRCIHAEFMTHRDFSRNAASSRAIPVDKLIKDVEENPFIPLHWGKNQKGMQAFEECDEPVWITQPNEDYDGSPGWEMEREKAWKSACEDTIEWARRFARAGYHKQIVNRLLEPFAHITVLVSSTRWNNFMALRDHPDAEPHIQLLAREIGKELEKPPMQYVAPRGWHLPFVKPHEAEFLHEEQVALSLARCASTSYKTVDGFDMTLDRAKQIASKLIESEPLHASPAEHLAMSDNFTAGHEGPYGNWVLDRWDDRLGHRNFQGFVQYRSMLTNDTVF